MSRASYSPATRSAEELMETTDLNLAGVIHDLNNVFQTMVEAADVLSEDPKWESLSSLISRSVERGKELTLSLQKAEQPPAGFACVLENAKSFVNDMLMGRGPAVQFSCDFDPEIVLQHGRSWERVLINLFSNSVRAMPEGGTIYVRGQRVGDFIEIVVADDGPGIAPDLLPRVFDPNVSTRRDGGLGLHIVETIVKAHEGKVGVANRSNGGAEFTILIPSEPPLHRRASA